MRALASIALLGALVIVAACDESKVPDISGEYVCNLEPVTTSWCHDGVDRPHVVTEMNVRIEQTLPGSAMHLHGWGANMGGSVSVGGDVWVHAGEVTCVPCEAPNEYDLTLEAWATYGKLENVELRELRHGQFPTPERGFFGFTNDDPMCIAEYRGTCTRQ